MERGALWRDNQQSTFAHIHPSSSHSTTSPWSPIPYPHCVSTSRTMRLDGRAADAVDSHDGAHRRGPTRLDRHFVNAVDGHDGEHRRGRRGSVKATSGAATATTARTVEALEARRAR